MSTQPHYSKNASDGSQEIVYSSKSYARQPGVLVKDIVWSLVNGRSLARRMFVRNLSGTYRQTMLGFIWILIPTLAQIGTWTFLAKQNVLASNPIPGMPFIVFIAVGSLLWQTFFDAVHAPLKTVTSNQSLITRINFPKESLILVAFWEVLFDFSVRLVLVTLMCLGFGVIPTWTALLSIPLVLALVGVGMSLGLLITPLGILYRDVSQTLSVVSPFWMVLTPVVYVTPESSWYRMWNAVNPPGGLLTAARDYLLVGHSEFAGLALIWLGISIPLLVVGIVWFRLGFPVFIERIAN